MTKLIFVALNNCKAAPGCSESRFFIETKLAIFDLCYFLFFNKLDFDRNFHFHSFAPGEYQAFYDWLLVAVCGQTTNFNTFRQVCPFPSSFLEIFVKFVSVIVLGNF
jgi:hypothetical protein